MIKLRRGTARHDGFYSGRCMNSNFYFSLFTLHFSLSTFHYLLLFFPNRSLIPSRSKPRVKRMV